MEIKYSYRMSYKKTETAESRVYYECSYAYKSEAPPQSKQSHVTLLHFIVRTYMRARGGALAPACALPVPEPGDVGRAAALDFGDVADSLAALRKNLDGE